MDAEAMQKDTADPEETEVDVANSAEDEEVNEETAAEKQMKNTSRAGFGLGFLLQQMRSASTSKTPSTKEATAEVKKVTGTIIYEEQIVKVKKTPRPKTKIDYDFSAATDKLPIQEVRDCFNSGTAPNFGFSKKGVFSLTLAVILPRLKSSWMRIFSYSHDNQKLDLQGSIRSGDLIYEIQWHPTEDLFASTSKDHPIHLWGPDAHCKLSFRGIDSADELASAFSLTFSLDGETLYGGYYKYIRIFNIERPGKQIKEIKTFAKGSIGGQKAILSCFSMCPTFAGSYAVGSFGGSIGLYSDQTGGCDCSFAASSPGVTQVQYSSDGNLLYAGYRKGMVLSTFHRPAHTNQRIAFQLDSGGQYLFSGSSTGDILAFDLKQGQRMTSIQEQQTVKPNWTVKASKAAVSGLSLHPVVPVVAITSGQRVFPDPLDSSSSSSECDELAEKDLYCSHFIRNGLDNSLKLWKF